MRGVRLGGGSGSRGFALGAFLGIALGLLFGRLGLGQLLGFELGQAFLLLAQFRFLARDQLRLAACFFFAARLFGSVDHRCGRFRRDEVVTLHEGALLAHFDLDRARFAAGVSLLDLGGFLAGHRDLFLFAPVGGAVGTTKMVQQLILIILGQGI